MEFGGIPTRWLFPADLKEGEVLTLEVAGTREHKCKNGDKMPVLIMTGSREGMPVEYEISKWSVRSEEKFSPEKAQIFEVSAVGNDLFFKPLQVSQP